MFTPPGQAWGSLIHGGADVTDHGWSILTFWPSLPKPQIPEHLPPEIERIYLQAERNYPVEGNEEAAGMMYRKSLDVGLRHVAPNERGTLDARIKKLVELHMLTASLGEWANQIRLLGNDSAHETTPPTRTEIETLRNFSDLVLRYLFTLPKLVELRKAEQA